MQASAAHCQVSNTQDWFRVSYQIGEPVSVLLDSRENIGRILYYTLDNAFRLLLSCFLLLLRLFYAPCRMSQLVSL